MVLAAILLVLVQTAVGMIVNLYVSVPAHHPGAHPSNYVSGSVRSVGWAIGHSAVALVIHACLGLALVVVVIWVAVRSRALHRRAVFAWSVLAAALVIGAGFNGASFLDFANDINSLIMALLALGALACYAVALLLLADRTSH